MPRAVILLFALLALLSACATSAPPSSPGSSAIHAVQEARRVSEEALLQDLATADLVLLGEQHDNPHHHRLQARVIDGLVARDRAPAVVMEMLDEDLQAAVDKARAEQPENVDHLAAMVDWEASGWPAWSMYRPILAAAYRHDLPIIAGNLSRGVARAIAMQDENALSKVRRRELGIDRVLSAADRAELEQIIRDSHCNLLPEHHMGGMVTAQQARDGALARAAIDAARELDRPIVVVTGNGHARTDVGIPRVLAVLAPELRVISLSFQGRQHAEPNAPYDYVWLTPSVARDDPCAALRERFQGSE